MVYGPMGLNYGVRSGSVDILAMLEWLENNRGSAAIVASTLADQVRPDRSRGGTFWHKAKVTISA